MHGSNLFTLALMVAAGAGVTLVPELMARDAACRLSGVTFRPLRAPGATRPITLAWSAMRYRTQAARRFAVGVLKAAGDEAGRGGRRAKVG